MENPHDLGGKDAGPLDLSETSMTHWDWQMDAMVRLLMAKAVMIDFAELRRGIEELGEDYSRLTYYEKWATSVAHRLVELDVLSQKEIDTRVRELTDALEKE